MIRMTTSLILIQVRDPRTKKLVCADRSETSEIFERADLSGPRNKKIWKRGPWIPDSAYGAGNSNYYNGNYDDMYGRKRRTADYWDYDYKLYDFDYEPGCSLSYQQTQVTFISDITQLFRNIYNFYIGWIPRNFKKMFSSLNWFLR